jgi:hypothetical protein
MVASNLDFMDIFLSNMVAPTNKGWESNWLQTIPGKSWWIVLRMYAPLQPWIDQTWRPGELELIE